MPTAGKKTSAPAGQQQSNIARREAEIRALLQSIGDGIITTDIDGNVSLVNAAALKMLGYKEDELIGQWFPKAVVAKSSSGDEFLPSERPITQAFMTGKPIITKLLYVSKSGRQFPVSVTVSPIVLDNQPIGAVEVFRDITVEHNIDRMKSEFISIASHQLRTPLSAIKTYSHLLSEGYVGTLSKEQTELMDTVMLSIDRMNELIDTLLDVSKIERGKLGLDLKEADLSKLLTGIVKEVGQSAKAKQLNITANVEPAVITYTDPVLVKEVYANLLSNAVKYTPAGGDVQVMLRTKDRHMVFGVKDTGYGIPKRFQSRVYSKFFRAPNVIQQETSGTGLGLYMVRSIADSLGGKVWFKSRENKGTGFYFSMPLRAKPKKAAPAGRKKV